MNGKGKSNKLFFVVKTRFVWLFISKTPLEKAGPTYLSPGTSAYQSTASQPKTLVHIPICWYHAPKRLCSKFSVESFSLLQFSISLENLSRFLNQSDVELKPTVSWPLTFSRSWARLLVFILRFHWFLLKFFQLPIVVDFGLGFVTLHQKALYWATWISFLLHARL